MFGIDMGVSGDQKQQYADLTSAGGFATGEGEGDISASDKFFKDILSGDSTKTAQALAPQIGAAKTSAQQQTATDAQFGNRGGGTNASSAAANDRVHSDITGLVGETTGKAASTLGSAGSGLLSTGIGAAATGFEEASKMQQQKEAKAADIAKSAVAVAAAPFTGGASLSLLATPSGGGGGDAPDLTGMSMPGKGGGGSNYQFGPNDLVPQESLDSSGMMSTDPAIGDW